MVLLTHIAGTLHRARSTERAPDLCSQRHARASARPDIDPTQIASARVNANAADIVMAMGSQFFGRSSPMVKKLSGKRCR